MHVLYTYVCRVLWYRLHQLLSQLPLLHTVVMEQQEGKMEKERTSPYNRSSCLQTQTSSPLSTRQHRSGRRRELSSFSLYMYSHANACAWNLCLYSSTVLHTCSLVSPIYVNPYCLMPRVDLNSLHCDCVCVCVCVCLGC